MSAKENGREPLMVTKAERHQVLLGVELRKGALEKIKTSAEAASVDPSDAVRQLGVIAGDGANGLLARLRQDPNAPDMFASPRPSALVRLLASVDGEPPTKWEAADPGVAEAWFPTDFPEHADNPAAYNGTHVEDQQGEVFKVHAEVVVTYEHVGSRPAKVVEAAVEASDAAAETSGGLDELEVARRKLDGLRTLAIGRIEGTTQLSVPNRERLRAYALAATAGEADWLRGWIKEDMPLGERPTVPEDWTAPAAGEVPVWTPPPGTRMGEEAETENPAPPEPMVNDGPKTLHDVEWASAIAELLAREKGLTYEDFLGTEPSSSKGYTKTDVEGLLRAKLEVVSGG